MPDCDPALSGAAIRRCEFQKALCLRRIVAAFIAITVAISVTTTPPVPAAAITLATTFSVAGLHIRSRDDTEMHKFDFTGLAELTAQLCESKVPVYLTIDLDCLDPSCFPGTGTPEAGGVSFLQLLDAIRTVTKANIIGADLNELAPTLDTTGVSTATACKVLRETLIALDKGWPGFQV